MIRSYSRENQDLFVLSVLDKKRNGTYVEIGGAEPIGSNNTFLLESQFDWTGISIEWDSNLANQWQGVRKNPCLQLDATRVDYDRLFEEHGLGTHIDFLQLDIDPAENTFAVLNKINFDKYKFSVITFEHDDYHRNTAIRTESREIIQSHGYTMVMSDVCHGHDNFEDWYINEQYMSNDMWKEFIGDSVSMKTPDLTSKYIELFNKL